MYSVEAIENNFPMTQINLLKEDLELLKQSRFYNLIMNSIYGKLGRN